MNVNLLFFASFKEQLDCGRLDFELTEGTTVAGLCEQLATKGGNWQSLFSAASQSVKVSVNQEMADMQTPLQANDEVAFFPPVTGG